MVVFAAPMYYFGISAQMKSVIDRFYSINAVIPAFHGSHSAKNTGIPCICLPAILPHSGLRPTVGTMTRGIWADSHYILRHGHKTKNPEVAGLQDFASVCPFGWWELRESNPRPSACKADALNQLS